MLKFIGAWCVAALIAAGIWFVLSRVRLNKETTNDEMIKTKQENDNEPK